MSQYAAQKSFVWTGIAPYAHDVYPIQHLTLNSPPTICWWHNTCWIIRDCGEHGYSISLFHQSLRRLTYTYRRGTFFWGIIRRYKQDIGHNFTSIDYQ